RSIFGPAAYFVDLLRFIQINIEEHTKNTIDPENKLLTRRPDLKCITLDKKNTTDLIPYIDLSNELLESFLRQGGEDAYTVIRESVYPHNLPFDRSLTEIRAYLTELSSGLPSILELLAQSSPSLNVAERLGLSHKELELISTPRVHPDRLAPLMGKTPPVGILTDMPVPDFLVATGLSRTQLNDLVLGDFDLHELNAGLSADLFVNNVDDGLGPMAIDAIRELDKKTGREVAKETVRNLSPAKLDRVLRFTRLAHALGWSFSDLDRVLRSLSAPSVPEASLRFDGVGDYLRAEAVRPKASAFATRQAFTLELWVRPEDDSHGPLFSVESRGVSDTESPLLVQTVLRTNVHNELTLSIRQGTANSLEELDGAPLAEGIELVGKIPLPVGEFSHVAVTVSEYGASLFVNGLADQTQALTSNQRTGFLGEGIRQTIEVGRARQGGYFCGVIKDIVVWDRALDRDAIRAARYNRWTGREAGIWAYWPMVETAPSYGVIQDRGPSAHHLALGGAGVSTQPRWVDRDLILQPLPSTVEPDALAFDGVNQYLAVDGVLPGIVAPLDTAPPLDALTVEVWARTGSAGGEAAKRSLPLASFEESPTSTREGFSPDRPVSWTFGLATDDAGGRQLSFGDPTGTLFDMLSVDPGPADNNWHHYAAVVKGQTVSFYVDGMLRGVHTSAKALSLPTALGELRVGAQFGPDYFHGDMRELRIWRIARTARELELDLYRPVASSRSGLVGYWPLQRLEAGSAEGAHAEDRSPGDHPLVAGGILAQYMPDFVTPDFVTTPATMPTEVAEPGRALSLDGETEVLVVDNPQNLGLGAHPRWTLEFWHRLRDHGASDEKVILTQGDLEAGMSVTLVPDGLK
ncbi:MAG: Tc toxin subunit A, partial [Myxococcales bacterium]|nr:Tc toxin subunit A [Myxococcales bacterium]